jgi:hypothetical protein
MNNDQKTDLTLQVVEEYNGLANVLGHERASNEMAHLLGEYILRGDLNQFEVDLIATVAILGHVATFVMNENERLRND